MDRIFQPFQRLAPDRTSRSEGLGLGLSIVQAIANAHHATIAARAQPHGGLVIEVTFPPPQASRPVPHARANHGAKIPAAPTPANAAAAELADRHLDAAPMK